MQAVEKNVENQWSKLPSRDFPGGAVVKNPPANAGDTGLTPGPGRAHMPQSYWAHVPQLLKPAWRNYWACMLQLLKPTHLEPVLRNKRSHSNEKPMRCKEERAPTWHK